MRLKFPLASLGLLLLAGTLGCSGAPSMSELQEKFERAGPWAKVVAAGAAKVRRFQKIDALMSEVNGVKHYRLGYSVEMECTAPVFVIEGPDEDGYEVYLDNAENDEFKRTYQTSFYTAQRIFVKELNPGDVDNRKGTLEVTLFEKGWK